MASPLQRIRYAVKLAFYAFRSAVTGRYVSEEEAKRHPETTVRERRDPK